jgi:hypothetical protein
VSVLDLDNGTLEAPAYTHGRLLENLCDPSRRWFSPDTFSAFVYAELHEIGIVACLYYYLCCVGTPVHPQDEVSDEGETDIERLR